MKETDVQLKGKDEAALAESQVGLTKGEAALAQPKAGVIDRLRDRFRMFSPLRPSFEAEFPLLDPTQRLERGRRFRVKLGDTVVGVQLVDPGVRVQNVKRYCLKLVRNGDVPYLPEKEQTWKAVADGFAYNTASLYLKDLHSGTPTAYMTEARIRELAAAAAPGPALVPAP